MKKINIIIFIISFLYFKIYSKNRINLIKNRFNMKKSDADDKKGGKIFNLNIKNAPNEDIKKFRKKMGGLGYGKIVKDLDITEADSCKMINEKLDKETEKNFFKRFLDECSGEDERKNRVDFLLKHSAFIDFLENEKDFKTLEGTYNSLKNLGKDVRNEELVNIYDAMLATPEFVKLAKNMSPDTLMKLNETVKLYAKVDKKDKEPIEGFFECVYKRFVFHTGVAEYVNLIKQNKRELIKDFKELIKPVLKKYIDDISNIMRSIQNDDKNKQAVESVEKDMQATFNEIFKNLKKQGEDLDVKGVGEGVSRKMRGYKVSCKESKVPLR